MLPNVWSASEDKEAAGNKGHMWSVYKNELQLRFLPVGPILSLLVATAPSLLPVDTDARLD
jgi:hypothetical protein